MHSTGKTQHYACALCDIKEQPALALLNCHIGEREDRGKGCAIYWTAAVRQRPRGTYSARNWGCCQRPLWSPYKHAVQVSLVALL